MSQERIKAYHQLIQDLLSNSGQGQEILIANSHLIDEGLVQTMVQVAQEWAQKGKSPEEKLLCRQVADFLIKIARQMAGSLGLSLSTSAFSPPTTRDSQLSLLFQALQVASKSEGNSQELYALLQDNLNLLDDNFAELLRTRATATLPKLELKEAQGLAGNIVIFSMMIRQFQKGNPASNIEIAIAGYEVAVTVFQTIPEMWATIQDSLGKAYCDRIRGERADNLEKAIEHYLAALNVHEILSKDWAETQRDLGTAYCERIKGEQAQNLEDAIRCFSNALKVFTPKDLLKDWAKTQHNLGGAYFFRIRGKKAENLEKAICCLLAASQEYTREADPQDWADTQIVLSGVYCTRIQEESEENIEAAIRCCLSALEVLTRSTDPQRWAQIQNNLGGAYLRRSRLKGGAVDDFEQAITCFNAALLQYTREPFQEKWAQIQNNLGAAYDEQRKITEAIKHYQLALEIYKPTAFPIKCLRTGRNLGLAASEIGDWATALQGLDYAIQAVEQSHSWAVSQKSKQEILENNIGIYELIIAACILIGQPEKAVEYAERSKARNLVELLANRDVYPQGEVPSEIITQLDRLRREMLVMQPQEDSEEIGNLAGEQATTNDTQARSQVFTNSLIELNPTQSYLNTLQQQLAEVLEQIKPYDPNFSITQKVKPIQFSEIQDLLDDRTAILEWYISGPFFRTFIITRDNPQPSVFYSSKTDRKKLEEWAENYRHSYTKQKERWVSELNNQLAELSRILHIDEIVDRIPPHITQLILIPHRWLHLFPLHALPVSDAVVRSRRALPENSELDDRPPDGYRLLDCFPNGVRYAPSCQLLQLAQKRQLPQSQQNLFAIQDPTEDLPYTNLEVKVIQSKFKPAHVLQKATATKAALTQGEALKTAHYAHFSCHGSFNFAEPLKSALILANAVEAIIQPNTVEATNELSQKEADRYLPWREGKTVDGDKCLTLIDIFEKLNLPQCRLVTLSACETGLTTFDSRSDEYIGLPSGFLYAGSPSVVSSLWSVSDLSTAFLIIKFYEYLPTMPSVAVALNQAQKWLRNLTSEEFEQLIAEFKPQIEQIIAHLPEGKPRELAKASLKASRNRKPYPFADPFYWAAFTATGV